MSEQLLIRNLPDGTKLGLMERARRHGRRASAESEARSLIDVTLRDEVDPLERVARLAAQFHREFGDFALPRAQYQNYAPRSPFGEVNDELEYPQFADN
jgi:plasmid stability protein